MRLYESENLVVDVPPSVERAYNVAKAAGKALVIVTGDPLFKSLSDPDMIIHVIKPCPCGFFGHDARRCACTVAQIEKYRATWAEYADALWVEGWVGRQSVKFVGLDGPCCSLLSVYRTEYQSTAAELVTIIETAKAIAGMDESKVIGPEHIAEAISYRQKRG